MKYAIFNPTGKGKALKVVGGTEVVPARHKAVVDCEGKIPPHIMTALESSGVMVEKIPKDAKTEAECTPITEEDDKRFSEVMAAEKEKVEAAAKAKADAEEMAAKTKADKEAKANARAEAEAKAKEAAAVVIPGITPSAKKGE